MLHGRECKCCFKQALVSRTYNTNSLNMNYKMLLLFKERFQNRKHLCQTINLKYVACGAPSTVCTVLICHWCIHVLQPIMLQQHSVRLATQWILKTNVYKQSIHKNCFLTLLLTTNLLILYLYICPFSGLYIQYFKIHHKVVSECVWTVAYVEITCCNN